MSTAKLKRHPPISREVRARARKFLAAGASYTTIKQELNISKTTVSRIKNNKYKDTVEEDASYYLSEREVGDGVAAGVSSATEPELEVIEISSDSESEKDELEEEEEKEGRKLRSMAGPSSTSVEPKDDANQRPRKAPDTVRMTPGALQHSRYHRRSTEHDTIDVLAPAAESNGKRARIEDDSSKEMSQKRQKRCFLEYKSCSDCRKSHISCDGPRNSSHICSKSKLKCVPRKHDETAARGDMSPPSSLSSLGSTSAALGRNAIAGGSSFRSNGAGPSQVGVRGSLVDDVPLHRLSLDPVPVTSSQSVTAPPEQAPSSSQGRRSGSSGSRSVDGPPNPVHPDAENKNEDSLQQLLAQSGLSDFLGTLQKCGFKSGAHFEMLKIHLGKDKTREEIRRKLEGGGMLFGDWLLLSDKLVPEYGG
ncbi:hypothetical protein DFH06DRAFT_1207555 [Mycena polygramma]|nr:hypothetical protein DFH06DRAFT_1207555 [Mycena polygramma]